AANRVQSGEESCFGTFLVDRATTQDDFSEARLVNEGSLEWRGRPFGGVGLFYVVHEIKAERFGSPGVECGENAGLAVGGHFFDTAEPRLAEHLLHHLATFVHAAIFGGDGGLANPRLQAPDSFVVTLFDFR